jgi:hypothetical protein
LKITEMGGWGWSRGTPIAGEESDNGGWWFNCSGGGGGGFTSPKNNYCLRLDKLFAIIVIAEVLAL